MTSFEGEPFAWASHARDMRRCDDEWTGSLWRHTESRVALIDGAEYLASDGGGVNWYHPSDAPNGRRLFLGQIADVAYFALEVDRSDHQDAPWRSTREALPTLASEEAGLLVHATALAQWHRAHKYCPLCGEPLGIEDSGHMLRCANCGTPHFYHADPAVIMLVTCDDRALLARKDSWAPGRFSTIAGFVDAGETLEQAVAREVQEEVGLRVSEVTYFASQPWPFPASLMTAFFAQAADDIVDIDGDEVQEARWFTRDEMSRLASSGQLLLPKFGSISRGLVNAWHGAPLPGEW